MQQKITNRNKISELFKKLIFMRLLETVGVPQCTNAYPKQKYNGADTPFKK